MEYQPEDTQASTAGDTYVLPLDALYFGARGHHGQFFGMKTEKNKQVCNDITLPALSYLPN